MNRCTILLICTTWAAYGAPVHVIRTVETREPADHALTLMHGETIELRVRMLNYAMPVDLTGYTVVLHGQTNGQSASESYQIAGLAGLPDDPSAAALGWASVALPVSTWWPPSAPSGRWTLVATAPGTAARVMRAGGQLTVRGSAAADAAAPIPQSTADLLREQFQADLAAAMQAEALARESGDAAALTNWQARVNALTNGAALGATALQPSWAATGHVATAEYADAAERAATADWAHEATHATDAARADDLLPDGTAILRIAADIAAATNDIVVRYLTGTNSFLTVSNSVLSIYAESNHVPVRIWSSTESTGSGIDPGLIDALWAALEDGMADKAPKAWGQYAPDGSVNPDPQFMTFLNTPAVVHASGFQWSSYGAYSVLSAHGAVAFESGADGSLRIGPNSTNYFGFVTGGSIIVGAVSAAIHVTDGGTPEGYAEIVYPYAGGDFPTLHFSPDLALDFQPLDGVVWVDNTNGTATVTAPATTPKGFWYATTSSVIDKIFVSTMPAHLRGGIIAATNVAPVVYDSVITVESGGKTYRMPAQEVDE